MYKVWHVLRLDLENFICGIILDNPKVKELNQAKHNADAINRYDECEANKLKEKIISQQIKILEADFKVK